MALKFERIFKLILYLPLCFPNSSLSFVRLLASSLSFPSHRAQYRAQHAAQHNLFICSEANISICYSTRHDIPLKSKQIFFMVVSMPDAVIGGGGCDLLNQSTGKIDLFLWYLCGCGCGCASICNWWNKNSYRNMRCIDNSHSHHSHKSHDNCYQRYMRSHSRNLSINWIGWSGVKREVR